jgi:hypothetical protein
LDEDIKVEKRFVDSFFSFASPAGGDIDTHQYHYCGGNNGNICIRDGTSDATLSSSVDWARRATPVYVIDKNPILKVKRS